MLEGPGPSCPSSPGGGGLAFLASGAGVCPASVKGMLRSFKEEVRRRQGVSLDCSGGVEGESSSGGHLARTGFPGVPSSTVVEASLGPVASCSSVRGGQEIFSLRVSLGLSEFSADP